ncbi:MAG: hypothetical protein JXQ73_31170 [Phycisphaerae bacterium]|nr:hypothetical protein [Phycisphaerae bacterium]
MSSINVVEVSTRRQLKAFIRFPMDLYAGCPFYVPPLIRDEAALFTPGKSPVLEDAEAKLFIATDGDAVVGRIAGIISHIANRKFGGNIARFGWFDAIEDKTVAAKLFDAVEGWAGSHGMEAMIGPLGFNNFDKEGLLTYGYDRVATLATYYNYPYYVDLVESCGFKPEADYVEYLIQDIRENHFPPQLLELAKRLGQRRCYRILEFKSRKQLLERAEEVMNVLQEAYGDLYGFVPFTKKTRDFYISKYFPFVHKDLIKVAVNEQDEVIGFFIAMPSLSEGLRRANGRLFPFGLFHLWRALNGRKKVLDCMLAGVRLPYRGRGVDLLMAAAMYRSAVKLGFETAESNPELTTNSRVQAEWKHFDRIQHKRRSIYIRPIRR